MARKSARTIAARSSREAVSDFKKTSMGDLFWDLLTFDRLLTGPVIHIIYWAGLLILVLGGFGVVGAAVGAAMHEDDTTSALLLALPMVVGGMLMLVAGVLIWRAFCEFYVALFRISDDLRAMRAHMEAGISLTPSTEASAPVDEPAVTPVRAPKSRAKKAG
jgi:hypothetical protein